VQESDTTVFSGRDIPAALGLLSRLPVRVNPEWARYRGARAAWAYPVAGAVIGLIAAGMGWIAFALGMGPNLAAAAVLVTLALTTGAMHEDGLADTADGLWGGDTPERRLQIMGDSRIGAYGVLALILITLARWSALATIFATGSVFAPVVAAAALSRVPMVVLMQALPRVRAGGLSDQVGAPGGSAVWGAVVVGAVIGFMLLGGAIFAAVFAMVTAAGFLAHVASARIGGQTGDILGASQQLCEVAVLAAIIAMM
jgi:adenosylcobinamide-GDP ribazoletransferase